MIRRSNYAGNVFWSYRVVCVRNEEKQRIEQCFGLQTAGAVALFFLMR